MICLKRFIRRAPEDPDGLKGNEMTDELKKTYEALEEELAERRTEDERVRRQLALLTAIVRIFRETPACETEEEVAQICLKVADRKSVV